MMEFTNASLEKVNAALAVVNEFTAEVLVRAEKWLDNNYRDNWELPAPHIVFHQEGWIVRVDDPEKVLNDTTGAPVKIVFHHPDLQERSRSFDVPAKSIFTEYAEV
jgi:hypothetical protein